MPRWFRTGKVTGMTELVGLAVCPGLLHRSEMNPGDFLSRAGEIATTERQLWPVEVVGWVTSTTRGPVPVYSWSAAMCSDALRNAGLRSSGGLRANFHGDNTGSNPVGDAK